jgi:hypothetical protein
MHAFSAIAMLWLLTGCHALVVQDAATYGVMYVTKPGDPDPANTADQIPQHESWCYRTMGEQADCYSKPQDFPPSRLVNVDPQSRYPLTPEDYQAALVKSRLPPEVVVVKTTETVTTVTPMPNGAPVAPVVSDPAGLEPTPVITVPPSDPVPTPAPSIEP